MQHFNSLKKNIKNEKGFSLAEVVIVLGILTFGLIGISSLLLQNMQVEGVTKNYLVASMLAQEGVELVRNVRDENWLLFTDDWLEDIPAGTFAIDYNGRDSIDYGASYINDRPQLYMDGAGFYSHTASARGTAFKRVITLDDYGDYFLLTVDVFWTSRFGERHYTINTTLFNWRGE